MRQQWIVELTLLDRNLSPTPHHRMPPLVFLEAEVDPGRAKVTQRFVDALVVDQRHEVRQFTASMFQQWTVRALRIPVEERLGHPREVVLSARQSLTDSGGGLFYRQGFREELPETTEETAVGDCLSQRADWGPLVIWVMGDKLHGSASAVL